MFQKIKHELLHAPRAIKQTIALTSDVLICVISAFMAMDLRLEQIVPAGKAHALMIALGVMLFVPIFTMLGLYRAIFRHAGLQVIYLLNKGLLFYFLGYALVFTLIGIPGVPKSMGLMQPAIFALGAIGLRLFVRHWLGGHGRKTKRMDLARALIYGAGSAGRQLAMGLGQSNEVYVVGYVDDDRLLQGHALNGLTIFSPMDLKRTVERLRVTQIYLALPSVSRRRRNEIIESLLHLKLQVRTVPGLTELTNGKVEVTDLKELDIEDLLGRDPVPPNPVLLAHNIVGKVVMVTGAGGSIGSELCRQIIQTGPSKLLLVEMTEYALYAIEQELRIACPQGVELIPLLADVRDKSRMARIMATWRPYTVYHAAAYKHVPLVEHNPAQGLRNNVWGTWVTAEQAREFGVSNFVLVSTDKAVRPTNIMGASKRLAEMVLQAMSVDAAGQDGSLRFSMVRFGNVLGSSGSVVPLFRKQIQQGGPITLTDPRITRYFMTIPEAAQLVIQAGAMADGGDVFVLDMGESIKIIDLAYRMIELSGLSVQDEGHPAGDIAIEVTGLRPGEKLYEELLMGDSAVKTEHPRILKAHEEFLPWPRLMEKLEALFEAVDANDIPLVRTLLQGLVPGYQPESEVVDWVWLSERGGQHHMAQ